MTNRKGFTLLELIVAMAMVAILAGSLYACLYVGFKSRDAAQRAVEPAQRLANVFTMMSQDLEGALPPTGIYAAAFQGFSGGASSDSGNQNSASTSNNTNNSTASKSQGLSAASLNSGASNLHVNSTDPGAQSLLAFFTSANVPREDEFGSDMRKVEYTLETPQHSTTPALMRRVYTNLGPSKEPQPREQVLCRNVRSAYMRFYDGTVWLDTWDSTGQGDLLPLAVEITLEMDLPDTRIPKNEWSAYKITRVFKVPCGVIATTSSGSTGSTGSSSGSKGGGK